MSRIMIPAVAMGLALVSLPSAAATVSTAWARLPSSNQEDCLTTASRAVEGVGFRASISQDRQTVFGWRGEEALTVRCISGHGVAVVFSWVNDQSNDSSQLVEAVTQALRRGAPPPPAGGNLGGGGGTLGGSGGFGQVPGGFGGGPVKR